MDWTSAKVRVNRILWLVVVLVGPIPTYSYNFGFVDRFLFMC